MSNCACEFGAPSLNLNPRQFAPVRDLSSVFRVSPSEILADVPFFRVDPPKGNVADRFGIKLAGGLPTWAVAALGAAGVAAVSLIAWRLSRR
jgi:hypothetical protein